MNPLIPSVAQGIEAMMMTLVKNIASHIIEYEWHAKATEEELIAYYGGAYVNRDNLLLDTLHRMHGDQMKLDFITKHYSHFITTYGNENPLGNIGQSLQRSTGISPQPQSDVADAAEDEPAASDINEGGSNDAAGNDSDGAAKDQPA